MVKALEGWSFDGVKGKLTVRAEDHALLQPMFQAKLTGTGADLKPELVKALSTRTTRPRRPSSEDRSVRRRRRRDGDAPARLLRRAD